MKSSDTAQAEGPSAYPRAASLEFRGATKLYPGSEAPAVDALDLDVAAGEICALVGPSGCGKTTALRMVNRMVELDSGDVLLAGRSIRERDPAELRREIGYVIQQIGLFPHRSVAENIGTVPRLLGWEADRRRARALELLDLVGLEAGVADRYPAQLSGGQRQRVGVARALAADPPLMLMDEPFGAIDPITRERLQDEFLRLHAELGKTVLFVTHDVDEAIKMGDRIAVMRGHGEVAQHATPSELLASPADEFVAGFVGADRALKRLALQRVSDVVLRPALNGAAAAATLRLRPDEPLRDALARMLQAGAQEAPVVDEQGRVDGLLSVEAIGEFLHGV